MKLQTQQDMHLGEWPGPASESRKLARGGRFPLWVSRRSPGQGACELISGWSYLCGHSLACQLYPGLPGLQGATEPSPLTRDTCVLSGPGKLIPLYGLSDRPASEEVGCGRWPRPSFPLCSALFGLTLESKHSRACG